MNTHPARRTTALGLAALLISCGGGTSPRPVDPTPVAPVADVDAPPVTPAGPTYRQVDADTPITTSWQAIVTIPAAWFVAEAAGVVRVDDPERDLHVALLALEAKDRDAAVAAAWLVVDPAFSLAVDQAVDLPATDGWDQVAQIIYVTPAAEHRDVVAVARRKGTVWHIVLIQGEQAAIDRRGAQLGSLILDMKVPGVDQESFAGKPANLDADHLARFDAFVEDARQLAGVPGAAIAVVHGGKIVLEAGHGVRVLGKKDKVDPSTLFMIGSTTKSLTTLMLARLVDQGKLAWDTPVTDVLPDFALGDAAMTQQLQLHHTICACTGMPRQDLEFIFEYAGWDAERRLASMKTMVPTTGFGETFQYSNLLVATGGYVGAHAWAPKKKLGPAYDDAMATLVFKPLGMKSTTFDFKKVAKADHAGPHSRGLTLEYGAIPVAAETALVPLRPAGAAWSSVRDMARFMELELARGKTPDGKQLVTEANLLHRREPQVKINDDDSYGLGLFLSNDHGVQIVHHGGNTLGFTADMFMLPEQDVGVVLLTNGGGANAYRGAVRRRFLEIAFDGEARASDELHAALDRQRESLADLKTQLPEPPDDAWLTARLGAYVDPGLGRIEITRKGKVFLLDAGEWQSEVTQLVGKDGVSQLITTRAPLAGLTLRPGEPGDDGRAPLILDAGQHVYTFAPVAK
ncbi:MAG: beta-lactamase family protein [Kofleriaceae bacterium]|nr:beta-lactamase family protein [Myxococcales bacterium]MCB9558976.1 beta-lactamase family protein [Kofleriaceae bacterium]MCB9570464.1 beta-lactamase family protein [Kofleriaceae bacterium]